MQTKSDIPTVPPALEEIVKTLRLTGAFALWVQLALMLVSAVALLFALFGQNFADETNTGLRVGIFWAFAGIIALSIGVYFAFRYTRIAKALQHSNSALRPRKADTIKVVRLAILVSLVGILLSLLGSGASLGVLLAKVVSQPPGVAIVDPNKIVRGLDVFVTLANVNSIAAHFIGAVAGLWLLDRLHQH